MLKIYGSVPADRNSGSFKHLLWKKGRKEGIKRKKMGGGEEREGKRWELVWWQAVLPPICVSFSSCSSLLANPCRQMKKQCGSSSLFQSFLLMFKLDKHEISIASLELPLGSVKTTGLGSRRKKTREREAAGNGVAVALARHPAALTPPCSGACRAAEAAQRPASARTRRGTRGSLPR